MKKCPMFISYTDYYNMFLNYRSSEHFKSFESDYANRDNEKNNLLDVFVIFCY